MKKCSHFHVFIVFEWQGAQYWALLGTSSRAWGKVFSDWAQLGAPLVMGISDHSTGSIRLGGGCPPIRSSTRHKCLGKWQLPSTGHFGHHIEFAMFLSKILASAQLGTFRSVLAGRVGVPR